MTTKIKYVSAGKLDANLLRHVYRTDILNILRQEGSLSQCDICKYLNLPKSTISKIVNEAISNGIIREAGKVPGKRKVPGVCPTLIELVPDGLCMFACAYRDDVFYYGIISHTGKIYFSQKNNIKDMPLEQFPQLIKNGIQESCNATGEKIHGVGLALGGNYRTTDNFSFYGGKYHGYPIIQNIRREIDVPVMADNYSAGALFAERYFGQASNQDYVVYLQMAPLCLNYYMGRQFMYGHSGFAGEIAALNPKDAPLSIPGCHCRPQYLLNFEKYDKAVIDEQLDLLVSVILNVISFYDPSNIYLSELPEALRENFFTRLDKMMKKHLHMDYYNTSFKVSIATAWDNPYITFGGAIIFDDVFCNPRITIQESRITAK